MLENVLTFKNVKVGLIVTIKTIVSIWFIVLAVGLPQLVHLFAGANGGMMLMPMYLPVLLAGLILGKWWGLSIAVVSPIISCLLTMAVGNAMPTVERLPFMIAELSVFAFIAGMFSKTITKNSYLAIFATILAMVIGRVSFLLLAVIFESVSGVNVSVVLSQIKTGLIGLSIQAVIVPIIVIMLTKLLKEKSDERI